MLLPLHRFCRRLPLLLFITSAFIAFAPSLFAQDTLSFGGVYDLPGAEVRATYTPVSPLAQRFTIEEVYRLPGTFYDPARLVALLPGVVQTNDQANHLSVRGNTPNANLWRLNGLAIVNPNHTANAGTFYDFPTLSGGGVNAISAQMLDNSGFLAGGLPVEYGFATGGTFDLRLRPGSKTKPRHQAQAGFIGFDLSTEGPIGKGGKTSYLVNARYSFTGLLADMGVDFGGEEIRFADFNGHLHHQWDKGELSVFTILGSSSNVFRGPDSTEQAITEQKELFDIDFASDLVVTGASFKKEFTASSIAGGIAYSSMQSDRDQWFTDRAINPSFTTQTVDFHRINANLVYRRILSAKSELKAGVEFLRQRLSASVDFVDTARTRSISGQPRLIATSPFIAYQLYGRRNTLIVGLRGSYFDGPKIGEWVIEPRVRWVYKRRRSTLTANFEVSAQPPAFELISAVAVGPRELFIPVGVQLSLRYGRHIGKVNLAATLFAQDREEEYGIWVRSGIGITGMNNFLEWDPNVRFQARARSYRYGIELEIAGGRKEIGWYYRGNATFLRSSSDIRLSKYHIPYAINWTLGREWAGKDRKQRERTFGLNSAIIIHAGERRLRVRSPRNTDGIRILRYFASPDYNSFGNSSIGTYFRPDLRLYKTKVRAKTTTTLALDLQNAAGISNVGNVYYDVFLERPNERLQLGLIPVLSYRIVWR